MITMLLVCLWLSIAVCTAVVVAEQLFGIGVLDFFVLQWSSLQETFKRRIAKLDSFFELSSEEEYLRSLVASIDVLNEKLEPILALAREKVANNIAVQAQIGRALEKSRMESVSWHKTAKKHLANGNEELAREALSRKLHSQMETEIFSELLEEDKQELDLLRANLSQISEITSETKLKSALLITRAKFADSSMKHRRKQADVNRRYLFANLDTKLIQLKHANVKSHAILSSALDGVSELLRTVESEVLTLEDNVLNSRRFQDNYDSLRQDETIQRALDELKKSSNENSI